MIEAQIQKAIQDKERGDEEDIIPEVSRSEKDEEDEVIGDDDEEVNLIKFFT